MRAKKTKIVTCIVLVAALVTVCGWYLSRYNVAVLSPTGQLGRKERNLIAFAIVLSIIVVVPVFAMTIMIAWKYRETNHRVQKKYSPDWDRSPLLEGLWWGIPGVIILVLSVVTWQSSHALDPYRSLVSDKKPLTVQVVALNWKWLFIYPDQHVASVNQLELPVNTPVDFQITSDTVMNSFWIPNLGGQIYAMPGMVTELHLLANKTGDYPGASANISGTGFAHMNFTARVVQDASFKTWVQAASSATSLLDMSHYDQLAQPSEGHAAAYYNAIEPGLYNYVVMKYMMPDAARPAEHMTGAPAWEPCGQLAATPTSNPCTDSIPRTISNEKAPAMNSTKTTMPGMDM